jgi:peptidoglycan/LPS O-acetylase OafA/YrhL
MGVDIFFVLSGFLITSLLIEEWDLFHSISLRSFYIRRALRLLPALVILIIVIVSFHWLASPKASAIQTTVDGLIALFYSTNWAVVLGFRQLVHTFGHTWTLSIEEQFYLTWPVILVFLLRRGVSRASIVRFLILAIFLILMERVAISIASASNGLAWINYATESRSDPLLAGCALSIALSSGLIPMRPALKTAVKWLAWSTAVPGLIFVNVFAGLPVEFYSLGLHLANAVFAALIALELLVSQQGLLHRILAQPCLVYVGKISYGIYLWHYPIFVQVQAQHWGLGKELTLEMMLTGTATLASFYLLERPILRFKKQFAYARRLGGSQATGGEKQEAPVGGGKGAGG